MTDDYERILEAIAAGEAIPTDEVRRATGNVAKTIKQVLLDLREAVRRLDWCYECGRRGVIRSSRKNEVGERTYHIICPSCKKTLSNQKRGNFDFVVYTQQAAKKLLVGSGSEN